MAGMEQLNLVGDPSKLGPYTLRLKFPKGFRIAPHSHPDLREVTIISGTYATGYGEKFDVAKLKMLPAGSFYTEPANVPRFHPDRRGYRAAGERHGAQRTPTGEAAQRLAIIRRYG